jgi:hypothetical protein
VVGLFCIFFRLLSLSTTPPTFYTVPPHPLAKSRIEQKEAIRKDGLF